MTLVQPVILKKIKNISALCHIQSKPSQRAKKNNVTVLSTSRPLHRKTIDDGKEKPQIIKFHDFTKRGTDIIDQLSDYYNTRAKSCQWVMVALYYMLETFRVDGKTYLLLERQRTYFKVLIIGLQMESCQSFRHYLVFTISWFDVSGRGGSRL